jgi:hypothetical protein
MSLDVAVLEADSLGFPEQSVCKGASYSIVAFACI